VPKGQKVAILNLEISPSSVLLYKKSKKCANKKGQKEVQIVPLILPPKRKEKKRKRKRNKEKNQSLKNPVQI
jgi:hypothetical protein